MTYNPYFKYCIACTVQYCSSINPRLTNTPSGASYLGHHSRGRPARVALTLLYENLTMPGRHVCHILDVLDSIAFCYGGSGLKSDAEDSFSASCLFSQRRLHILPAGNKCRRVRQAGNRGRNRGAAVINLWAASTKKQKARNLSYRGDAMSL